MTVHAATQQRWIHRDIARGTVAAGLCLVAAFAYPQISARIFDVRPDVLVTAFLAWDVYALVQILLTVRAFSGVAPERLPALVERTRPSSRVHKLLTFGEGPGTAVTLAAVALSGAALLPRLDLTTSSGNLLRGAVIIASVVLSWVVVVVSYAVFYARRDFEERGLDFPGDDAAHGWSDYLYFSLAVAATFGTTDVEVVSARMRRTVLTHTAITFVFNTVIIALLVAALSS